MCSDGKCSGEKIQFKDKVRDEGVTSQIKLVLGLQCISRFTIQLDTAANSQLVLCSFKSKSSMKKMIIKETVCDSVLCVSFRCSEGGWFGWRDDTEEILWIRTMHGQLPPLIHLPYRHFLSFGTLAKLLVWGGGWQRIYVFTERERKDEFMRTTGAFNRSKGWAQTDT